MTPDGVSYEELIDLALDFNQSSSSPNFETPVTELRGVLEFAAGNGERFRLPDSASISLRSSAVIAVPDSDPTPWIVILFAGMALWHARLDSARASTDYL
jgi:hypothetical protein